MPAALGQRVQAERCHPYALPEPQRESQNHLGKIRDALAVRIDCEEQRKQDGGRDTLLRQPGEDEKPRRGEQGGENMRHTRRDRSAGYRPVSAPGDFPVERRVHGVVPGAGRAPEEKIADGVDGADACERGE